MLSFPYQTVVAVFRKFGIDAAFNEGTPDADFAKKVAAYDALPAARRLALGAELLNANRADVDQFVRSLQSVVLRQIERIIILPLHGSAHQVATVGDAIKFIEKGTARPRRRVFPFSGTRFRSATTTGT